VDSRGLPRQDTWNYWSVIGKIKLISPEH
jgi:hypothetical protein